MKMINVDTNILLDFITLMDNPPFEASMRFIGNVRLTNLLTIIYYLF